MGKPKGKRAWRKNIDLGEERYVEKKNEDVRLGGAVDELPDDSLFFTDKDGGLAAGGGMAIMNRKEKARAKVLRVDSILTKQPTSKKFPVPIAKGNKGPPSNAYVTKGAEAPRVRKPDLDKAALAVAKKRAASASVTKATRAELSAHKEKISGKALYKPSKLFTLDDVLQDDRVGLYKLHPVAPQLETRAPGFNPWNVRSEKPAS
jgi:hypothetical protein